MPHPISPLQEVNPLGPLLDKRKLSRRTLLDSVKGHSPYLVGAELHTAIPIPQLFTESI
jgi:hypothetical protein